MAKGSPCSGAEVDHLLEIWAEAVLKKRAYCDAVTYIQVVSVFSVITDQQLTGDA